MIGRSPLPSSFEAFRLTTVGHIIGWFTAGMGALMVVPAVVDAYDDNTDWQVFATASAATVFIGLALATATRGPAVRLDRRSGFVLTTGLWVCLAAAGAVPLAFSSLGLSVTDAYFEAMSGLTTTGSTILTGLDNTPPGILLWRGMLQWVGGIGFVVVGFLMLPFLRVGGMQLFKLESSEKSEKAVPKIRRFALMFTLIYVSLTVMCAVALDAAGMTELEAVVHAMTTLSTGGFSTSDASVGHFGSALIKWIIIVFMTLGSLPFFCYIRAIQGRPDLLVGDEQVRNFVRFIVLVSVLLAVWLYWNSDHNLFEALTTSTFHVISIVTTTGFAVDDYTLWGAFPFGLFFILTLIGGCTGSTAGGIKIFRYDVLFRALAQHVHRLIYPHGTFAITYSGQIIAEDVVAGVLLFMGIYIITLLGLTGVLSFCGLDLVTALSGAATALGNVGPGLGALIGPAGTFQTLPDAAKWILSLGMMLGRLELFTVLALLAPGFWQR